ncbi:flagellar hook-associated protein FlgL [Rosistilla carotiformis]|uniref:Flagellar hook-associated protein FlgL n=1 Tax=Rosistilla carotiformis TaxID=2528017 RepID=A0A518JY38_9BACT|nr:flagellin hook IN motif-containing protein [Rosistilla carotiformis]QDV70456.1 flagellar hook-associated protein FlgL [Rosistilla carotiformis]
MSLLPVSTPRTADALTQQRLIRQLNYDSLTLENLYTQLSTGQRVNTLSDDPSAAISAVSLQASQEYSATMLRNAQSAEGYLNVTDTVSATIDNALIEAQGTIIAGAQDPLGDAERDAYAQSLSLTIDRLITAANQSYRGHYVLGGAIDQTAPLAREEDFVVWSGTSAVQSTQISKDWLLETGINAQQSLGVGASIASSVDLDAAVTRDTPLSKLYGGKGVVPSVIRASGGDGWTDIDLRAAKTVGDLQDALNSVSLEGRDLSVTLSATGISVDYADGLGGTLSIDDVGEGKTADLLGIRNPQGYNGLPLVSHNLNPAITGAVKLTDVAGGAGIDVSAGIQIDQGSRTFTVDLSLAETIEDVVVAINLSGADVKASINQSTGKLQIAGLADGVDYSIGENGGNAAAQLGLRTATTATKLSELNRGLGFEATGGTDLTISRTDGSELEIDVDGASTIADVIDRINNHVDNLGPNAVTASLRTDGNGIQLQSIAGTSTLTVGQPAGSSLGEALGLIAPGSTETTAIDEAGNAVIRGSDYKPVETGSTLDTLLRMQTAIQAGDIPEITRLAPRMDQHLQQSVQMRAEVGSRVQNLDNVRQQTEELSIELAAQLSNQIDADFASVISEMTARQQAMQASLQVTAQISQLTVLNFL